MSKKNRRNFNQPGVVRAGLDMATEYKVIKHDLLRVVILNVIFLAGMLALYYTNLRSHYLETWFSKFINF